MSHTVHVFRVAIAMHCPVGEVPGDTEQEAVDTLMEKFVATGRADGGLNFHVENPGQLIFAVERNGIMVPVTPTKVAEAMAEVVADKPSASGEVSIERLTAMLGENNEEVPG